MYVRSVLVVTPELRRSNRTSSLESGRVMSSPLSSNSDWLALRAGKLAVPATSIAANFAKLDADRRRKPCFIESVPQTREGTGTIAVVKHRIGTLGLSVRA